DASDICWNLWNCSGRAWFIDGLCGANFPRASGVLRCRGIHDSGSFEHVRIEPVDWIVVCHFAAGIDFLYRWPYDGALERLLLGDGDVGIWNHCKRFTRRVAFGDERGVRILRNSVD